MFILYDKKGAEVHVHHAIDVREHLATGDFFEDNPMAPKSDNPSAKKPVEIKSSVEAIAAIAKKRKAAEQKKKEKNKAKTKIKTNITVTPKES